MTLELSDEDPRVGTVLDSKLKITSVLGRGGMGVVYRARQLSMDRDVAVKVLHPSASTDQESVQRFLHEAKVASKMRHPNLITVFDFGQTDDGLLYLVMEMLQGAELADVLELEHQLDPVRAVKIAIQVLDAVHHAHEKGLIHRDLKPENVFVLGGSASRRGDFVKVLDFGIARNVEVEGSERLTRTGMLCGTPAYMSPEQILGDKIDGRSDLYSMGVMLFELLVGRLPFMADTPMRLMMAHLDSAVPTLASTETAIPPALYAVIAKAMAKKPNDRFENAVIMADALAASLNGAAAMSLTSTNPATPTATAAHERSRALSDTAVAVSPTSTEANLSQTDVLAARDAGKKRGFGKLLAAAIGLGGAAVAAVVVMSSGAEPAALTGGEGAANTATQVEPESAIPVEPIEADTRVTVAVAEADTTPAAEPDTVAVMAAEPETVQRVVAAAPDTVPAEDTTLAVVEDTTPPAPLPIALATDPPGASVTVDGAKLGTRTPTVLPRPAEGETVKVVLRLHNHRVETVTLTAESEDTVVTLKRRRRAAANSTAVTKPGPKDAKDPKDPKDPKAGSNEGAGIID